MLRSYLKLAIRNLWKHKTLSAINIIGLAAGLCCLLLAIMYWRDERSYDTFHINRSNLYRVTTSIIENKGDKAIVTGGTGQVQGPAFKALVPEVAEYVRLLGGGIYNDYAGNEKILRLKLLFGDENFFNVFSFKLIKGDPNTALKELNSVVLTASTAIKLFKTTDVLGKELHMQADPSAQRLGKPLVISGVVEDLPGHSSIQFEVLHPFRFLQLSFEDQNWVNAYLGTFVVLNPNADKQAVIKKLNGVYKRYAAEQIKNNGHDPKISYGLQPVTDIHLNPLTENGSSMEGGISNGSRPIFSYLFLAISMFILIMASINFINISIGASLKRIREVGIRKIAGSNRIQIILQFLGESAILSTIAFVLALLTTNAALPVFNRLTGKELSFQNLDAGSLTWFLLLFLTNIVLTGLYPAYVLSNFKPIEALQSRQKLFSRNMFGQALVVVQFSLSVLLIVASIVLFTQMKFVKTKDLGYQPDQVIKTSIPGNRILQADQRIFEK
jgi:putative ABC transport system permease protein